MKKAIGNPLGPTGSCLLDSQMESAAHTPALWPSTGLRGQAPADGASGLQEAHLIYAFEPQAS